MELLHEIPRIRRDLNYLLRNDPGFKKHGADLGSFDWPFIGPDFPGLVRIVIGQQLSTRAADSLWRRFCRTVKPVSPGKILKLSSDDMRGLGLSRQKSAYIAGLAQAAKDRRLVTGDFESMSDEDVSAAITALKGLGPWSAQMYLMFGLARPDIWAPGDLGIQEGLKIYLGKKTRPTAAETLKHGDRFAPRRTAASLLLWHIKGRESRRPAQDA